MTNLPVVQTRTIFLTQTRSLKSLIPETLFAEREERMKALEVTDRLIREYVLALPENAHLTVKSSGVSESSGGLQFIINYNANVEVDAAVRSKIVHLDSTTFNLLINNKILTVAEKRQLLKDRGLMPKTKAEKASS